MNQNIKPIAMRCNQEQFNAIQPKLERAGLEIEDITFFHKHYYLTNNLGNKLGMVSNIDNGAKPEYGRTIFEEWNEQTFLEYCGIESFVLPEKWCVEITESNREVLLDWARKQPNYTGRFEHLFVAGAIVLSKHPSDDSYLWAGDVNGLESVHSNFKLITFEQFQKYVLKQEPIMKKYTNYTVPATDVLKIRAIACGPWKRRFATYLHRMDESNNLTFIEEEIDEMFNAATKEQRPTLVEIFGEPTKAIEWDRIRTGSKVMIEYTGQSCGNLFEGIDFSQPVDVVFYKTPHFINDKGIFYKESRYSSYCTFHQGGKYFLFAADDNVDYITEVVEY
jgi:hypothetical protein